MRRGLARMETVIVNDPFWTATARHADIVLPATISLERDDIGAASGDPSIVPMRKALEPYAQARNEFQMFSDLADALGVGKKFHENLTESEWLERIYEKWRAGLHMLGYDMPVFADFWAGDVLPLPNVKPEKAIMEAFRDDPAGEPLRTPSGKVEIFSETIDGFGYDDCAGHPAWFEPAEWHRSAAAATFPLLLVANNPKSRLHSQLDVGATSQATKIQGREPVRIHPADARRARNRGRRHCPSLQRTRQLPGRRHCERRDPPGRGAAFHRGLVRPARPGRFHLNVRPRQPKCAHPRPRHVETGPGMRGPAHAGRNRALDRAPAGDSGERTARDYG